MMRILMFFFLGLANAAGFFTNFLHGPWQMGHVERFYAKPFSHTQIRIAAPPATLGILHFDPPAQLTFRWENGTTHRYRIEKLGPIGIHDSYGPSYDWILLLNELSDPFNITRQTV